MRLEMHSTMAVQRCGSTCSERTSLPSCSRSSLSSVGLSLCMTCRRAVCSTCWLGTNCCRTEGQVVARGAWHGCNDHGRTSRAVLSTMIPVRSR